jgi:hypothetical protein
MTPDGQPGHWTGNRQWRHTLRHRPGREIALRSRYVIALAAFAAPMLAGCVDDRPFPVANTGAYSSLPPLPPPNYGASTTPVAPAARSVRRAAARSRARLSDDQIRIRILQQAVTSCAPGQPCVCPDVTPDMIADWRRQHGA